MAGDPGTQGDGGPQGDEGSEVGTFCSLCQYFLLPLSEIQFNVLSTSSLIITCIFYFLKF